MRRSAPLFFAALAAALPALAAAQWKMQYYYDEERTTLSIADLAFPSPQRGIAVGTISQKEHTRGTAVVTSDGGAHWALVPLPAPPLSVFFLDDTRGWAVTTKGILATEESGRTWHKLANSPRDMIRVHFLDAQHGFAVGFKKSVYETHDGGAKWERLAIADSPQANPAYTVYDVIAFANPRLGMITGWNRPPRRDEDVPDWMQPERASRRPEWPTLSIMLTTGDGGKTWKPSTASIFGQISRVSFAPDGRGLGLIEFRNAFDYPSEVFRLEWKHGGGNIRVFREKNRAVTDVLLPASGPAYLAAISVAGTARLPIPGKLKMLESADLNTWNEMEVDYRASAQRAILASPDPQNIWVATDTGMILKLSR